MDDDATVELYKINRPTSDRRDINNWYGISRKPATIDVSVEKKCMEASAALIAAVKAWIPRRNETIAALKVLADHVSKVKKDDNISNIAGSTTAIVGAAGIIITTGITIATAGLGAPLLAPAYVFTGATLAGSGVGMGATCICNRIIDNDLKDAMRLIEQDDEEFKKVLCQFYDLQILVKRGFNPLTFDKRVRKFIASVGLIAGTAASTAGVKLSVAAAATAGLSSINAITTGALDAAEAASVATGTAGRSVTVVSDIVEETVSATTGLAKVAPKASKILGAFGIGLSAIGIVFDAVNLGFE